METTTSANDRIEESEQQLGVSTLFHPGLAISEIFVRHTSSSLRDSRCIYYELARGIFLEFGDDHGTKPLQIRESRDKRGQITCFDLLHAFCQKISLGFNVAWFHEFGICLLAQAMFGEFEAGKAFKDGALPFGIKGLKFLDFATQFEKMQETMRTKHTDAIGNVNIVRQDLYLPGQNLVKLDICSTSSVPDQLACQVFLDPSCEAFFRDFIKNVEIDWHSFQTILVGACRVLIASKDYVNGSERNQPGRRDLEIILYQSYLRKSVIPAEQTDGEIADVILYEFMRDRETTDPLQTDLSAKARLEPGKQVCESKLNVQHARCPVDNTSEAGSSGPIEICRSFQQRPRNMDIQDVTDYDIAADEVYNGDAEEEHLTSVTSSEKQLVSKKTTKRKKSKKKNNKSQTMAVDLSEKASVEQTELTQKISSAAASKQDVTSASNDNFATESTKYNMVNHTRMHSSARENSKTMEQIVGDAMFRGREYGSATADVEQRSAISEYDNDQNGSEVTLLTELKHLPVPQVKSAYNSTESQAISLIISDLPTIPENEAISPTSDHLTVPVHGKMIGRTASLTLEDESSSTFQPVEEWSLADNINTETKGIKHEATMDSASATTASEASFTALAAANTKSHTSKMASSRQLSATAKAFAPQNPTHEEASKPKPASEQEFKFDNMHNKLLKCFNATCRKMTNCWDPDVRACPSCGPESFVRYCSKTCLFDTVTVHLATYCPMKPLPFTIDRTTIRPSQLPMRSFIKVVPPFTESIERYRQAIHYSVEPDGEYCIFDDIESIEGGTYSRPTAAEMQAARGSKSVPVFTTNFGIDLSPNSRKRRFQSLLESILAHGSHGTRQRKACIDAFAMIKQNLEENDEWDEDMCTYLIMQVGFEWQFHNIPMSMQCFDAN